MRVYCQTRSSHIAFINMFSLGECYEACVLFIELFFMVTKSGNESLHENNWREGGQDEKIRLFSGLIKT